MCKISSFNNYNGYIKRAKESAKMSQSKKTYFRFIVFFQLELRERYFPNKLKCDKWLLAAKSGARLCLT